MNSQSQTKHFLLICGAPRSGLNLLTDCMRYLGIKPIEASNLPDPAIINHALLQDLGISLYTPALPKGWLESKAAVKAQDWIDKLISANLSSTEQGISKTDESDPSESSLKPETYKLKHTTYIAAPLISRTFPLWCNALESAHVDYQCLLMLRHPWEVAMSLNHNEGLDFQTAHIAWLSYVRQALHHCPKQTTVSFDQLLADPVSTLDNLLFPYSSLSAHRSSLLDFVQPSLKHHHAGSFTEKYNYKPYADIYNQLRLEQYSLSAQISDNQRMECPSAFTSPYLVDNLLQALGQHENVSLPEASCSPLSSPHSPLTPLTNNQSQVTVSVTLPSSNKKGCIAQPFPLVEDQWQKIPLSIPETSLLKDSPIVINPLNVIGTIKISVITIENKSTGKTLWKIQTPQDFDSFTLNDDLYRLVDLENLVLLAIGPNPILTLPLLKDLPDVPLELSIWMKANKNLRMLHKTSSSNIARFKKMDSSNLVWLASYPRSGNTWLRIILRHNFGLKSYSVYNDTGDIGKYIEISEAVGHQYMHWESVTKVKNLDAHSHEQFSSFDSLRYKTSNLKLVKTHSQFHEGFLPDKVVYIYRDGRASLRSFASYLHDFSNRRKELNKLLDELLCGCDTFTSPWSRHILSWKETSHDKVLFLKFEDVLSDITLALKKIAAFLEIQPIRTDVLTFDELHAINPDFFRKGQKKSWHDLFDDTRHALFWILNHEAMDLLGYDQDKHLICEALFHNKESGKKLEPVSASQLDYFNHILQHCGSIILAHISSIPDRNRQFMSTSLQNAHDKLAAYFSHWDAQGKHRAWIKDWEQIFMEFDNNEQE